MSLRYIANANAAPNTIYFINNYFISIFSGSIPLGRYRIITNRPIPTIKNLKYGALFIKCIFIAFVSGKCDVDRLIKNSAIGATSTHKNQTNNHTTIDPKLFPVPPPLTLTQITHVYLLDL